MKKIILVFISTFLLNINVLASTYYGEYKFVGHDELKISDEVKKEEVKLYNTFSYKKIDMGYMLENNEYMKDDKDFIYKDILTNEYNDNSIEEITLNIDNKNINKITIKNLHLGLKIKEIEVYYKNELIKCNYNWDYISSFSNLIDSNYNTFVIFLNNKTYLDIILNEYYSLNDLKIIIYTYKDKFNTKFSINNKEYLLNLNNSEKHIIKFSDLINDIEYLYINNKKLYKYYKKDKVVDNIYVKDGENLILDDYKYINKFYKRDKLVLNDNNIINSEFKDVYSFIEYSSDKVEVICDIDYSVNGTYNCLYKLNDIEIIKDIVIDNKEESINYNNEENIDYISYNDKQYINEVKEEIKTVKIKNNENKLINEIDIENKNSYFILYVIVILIISILIIGIIKRKKSIVEKV